MRDFTHEPRPQRPKKSRSKAGTQRPYLPPYADREEIAYRLRVSIGTVDNWIKARLLPEPVTIFGGMERWHWPDIEEAIEALNLLANDSSPGATSENDPFLKAFKRGPSADA